MNEKQINELAKSICSPVMHTMSGAEYERWRRAVVDRLSNLDPKCPECGAGTHVVCDQRLACGWGHGEGF